jgi:hypothetical protein
MSNINGFIKTEINKLVQKINRNHNQIQNETINETQRHLKNMPYDYFNQAESDITGPSTFRSRVNSKFSTTSSSIGDFLEEFAKKFAGMPLPQALKELGKLEFKYSPSEDKAVAVRKSKAPPPINPIRGTSGSVDAPINERGEFTGTVQQWKEMRKSGKIR